MTTDLDLVASIRKRPGMYVGSTGGSGLHHMLWEVVSNALDECLAGRATRIDVTLNENGSVTVEDDGAGVPLHDVGGITFAELALTSHHTTGTLDGHAPHTHVGLFGVGLCVVNALSASLLLDVFREGHHHRQLFQQGRPQSKLARVEPTGRTGTRVTFMPDPEIFSNTEMSFENIAARLRELALLNRLPIALDDNRRPRRRFAYPEGLVGFLDRADDAIVCQGVANDIRVEAALRWGPRHWTSTALRSFANSEPTHSHGTHVDGLMWGIADAFAPAMPVRARHSQRVRKRLEEGLQAVVHVNIANPTFGDPTRDRLSSPEALEAVRSIIAQELARKLDAHPELREMHRRRRALRRQTKH